jgi:Gas vesicle protein
MNNRNSFNPANSENPVQNMSSPFDQIVVGEEWEESELSLLETLDHVLNRGLVIAGEITISVADIDLIFIGLNVLVSSVETAHQVLHKRQME